MAVDLFQTLRIGLIHQDGIDRSGGIGIGFILTSGSGKEGFPDVFAVMLCLIVVKFHSCQFKIELRGFFFFCAFRHRQKLRLDPFFICLCRTDIGLRKHFLRCSDQFLLGFAELRALFLLLDPMVDAFVSLMNLRTCFTVFQHTCADLARSAKLSDRQQGMRVGIIGRTLHDLSVLLSNAQRFEVA